MSSKCLRLRADWLLVDQTGSLHPAVKQQSGNESGGEGEGKHNKAKITDGTNNFHAVKIINENRNKCFFMYSMKNAYNNCSAILLLCSINVCLAVIN